MTVPSQPIYLATRGSALALAQANKVLRRCQALFPDLAFEIKIFKTTGDKLQTASLANESLTLPKGLFTKELENALLAHEADLAVHSLKDLPTELPAGLILGAVTERADPRDVLIYRDGSQLPPGSAARGYSPDFALKNLPPGAVIGTSSTRRKAQLLSQRPDLKIIEHRGNVLTRIEKLVAFAEIDVIVLAAAGLDRLGFTIAADGKFSGAGVPPGLLALPLAPETMLPCVGQGAIGIETRADDAAIQTLCAKLNDPATSACVTAERAFLAAMGGGCQSPVAAHATFDHGEIFLRAISFHHADVRAGHGKAPSAEAATLGRTLAKQLK